MLISNNKNINNFLKTTNLYRQARESLSVFIPNRSLEIF